MAVKKSQVVKDIFLVSEPLLILMWVLVMQLSVNEMSNKMKTIQSACVDDAMSVAVDAMSVDVDATSVDVDAMVVAW